MRERFWLPLLVCAALAGAVTGCSGMIAGEWRMVEAYPHRDVIRIDNAVFRKDGTYSADTTFEGKSQRQNGTYKFNGYNLRLVPDEGGRREFTATLKLNRLELSANKKRLVLQRK